MIVLLKHLLLGFTLFLWGRTQIVKYEHNIFLNKTTLLPVSLKEVIYHLYICQFIYDISSLNFITS